MKVAAAIAAFGLVALGLTGCGGGSGARTTVTRQLPAVTKTVTATARATPSVVVKKITMGPVDGTESPDLLVAKLVHNSLIGTTGTYGLSDDEVVQIAEYDCKMLPTHTLPEAFKLHAAYAKRLEPVVLWDTDTSRKFLIAAADAKCPKVTWIGKGS